MWNHFIWPLSRDARDFYCIVLALASVFLMFVVINRRVMVSQAFVFTIRHYGLLEGVLYFTLNRTDMEIGLKQLPTITIYRSTNRKKNNIL